MSRKWDAPLETRFWSKVNRQSEDECWEWVDAGAKTKHGYGRINISGVYEELEPKTTLRVFWYLWERSHKDFSQFNVPAGINSYLKPEI